MRQEQTYNGETPSGRHIIEINQRNTSLLRENKQRPSIIKTKMEKKALEDIFDQETMCALAAISFCIHQCLMFEPRISTLFGELENDNAEVIFGKIWFKNL